MRGSKDESSPLPPRLQVERGSRELGVEAQRGVERVRAHAGGHLPASGARLRIGASPSDETMR
eukprot:2324981-Pleurochrysis_carterae.AAC.1